MARYTCETGLTGGGTASGENEASAGLDIIPSIMAGICFFSGINLLFMGMIGEYIGRIFLSVSNNPQYVVRQVDEHDSRAENEGR